MSPVRDNDVIIITVAEERAKWMEVKWSEVRCGVKGREQKAEQRSLPPSNVKPTPHPIPSLVAFCNRLTHSDTPLFSTLITAPTRARAHRR